MRMPGTDIDLYDISSYKYATLYQGKLFLSLDGQSWVDANYNEPPLINMDEDEDV